MSHYNIPIFLMIVAVAGYIDLIDSNTIGFANFAVGGLFGVSAVELYFAIKERR